MTDSDTQAPAEPANGTEGHIPAAGLIEIFGGIRPMAAKLGIAVSTVQGWKQRDAIPGQRLDAIRATAARHGISLDGIAMEPAEARPAAEAKPGSGPTAAKSGRRHRQQVAQPWSPLLPLQ